LALATQIPTPVNQLPEENLEEIELISTNLRKLSAELEAAISRRRRREEEQAKAVLTENEAREKEWEFNLRNPPGIANVVALKTKELENEISDQMRLEHKRDELLNEFRGTQTSLAEKLRLINADLAGMFAEYCHLFLDEECSVELDEHGSHARRRGVGLDPIHASFYPVVSGAARYRPDSLSEAQRLFVDLAFRMAVLDLWAARSNSHCTLLIEAPEGSVDLAYMSRVAGMLREFASRGHTLIITTNVNNDAFLPALFSATPTSERRDRILNLLDLGRPRPVQQEYRKKFDSIIDRTVTETEAS
jgi:hypothetical protein